MTTTTTRTRKKKGSRRRPLPHWERENRRIRALRRASDQADTRFLDYWNDLLTRFSSMDPESTRLQAEMDAIHPAGDREPLRAKGEDRVAFCRARDEWDAKFGAKWETFRRTDEKLARLYQMKRTADDALTVALRADDDDDDDEGNE